MNAAKQPYREFPGPIYWLLLVALWALLIGTVATLFLRWKSLETCKVFLYAGLLGGYLWAERRAYHEPAQPGLRAHEGLRYLLSLGWWILTIGSLLEYAVWPRAQLACTIAGVLLTLAGAGLRIWSVSTLGQYFSGHIEAFEGQPVVEAGPYRWIRHPGYAGNILQVFGSPLVVNAYPALALSLVVAVLFLRRMFWEEQFLRQKIPGYATYIQRTKRLIPGIW